LIIQDIIISLLYQVNCVRISKIFLILIITVQVFGQTIDINIGDVDILSVNNNNQIYSKLDSLLTLSDDIGDYFILSKIISDRSIAYNRKSIEVKLDSIIFRDDNEIRTSTLNQIFKSLYGTEPINKTTLLFNTIVNGTTFLINDSEIIFGLRNNKKVVAVLDIKSDFNNYFSGLIGASRSDEQKWTVNGQMDIHLENQWRTANIVDLHWKRLDEESQILNLKYEEPHPFGLPIGVRVAYNQDLREGNYVNTQSAIGIIKTVPGIGKLGFGGKNTKINSTAKGDSLGLPNIWTQSVYVDGLADYRNDYWLPTHGYFISLNSDIGKRTVSDSNTVIITSQVVIEKYSPIWNRSNITFKLHSFSSWISSGELHTGEQMHYGGTNSLRGYNEDNFHSNWVIIPSIEYNIKFSSDQQITLFIDSVIQEKYSPLPYGYGIGFTQVTKNSVLKLFYGLGRGDAIKNGKIHLQFLTRL